MQDLENFRLNFTALANKKYFNFGGQGPLPKSALTAMFEAYELSETDGPFSSKMNRWAMTVIETLKGAIAAEIGVTPETLTLTENVTAGCNIALWGIDWQPEDEILLGDCEHPGVIGIVKELMYRFGIKLRICSFFETLNGGDPVAAIAQHLTPKTRVLILSHVQWNTGQVLPLKEIVEYCHREKVQVMVDAAQSVGLVPLNLTETGVDYYAFTGHKWLCGPAGVGGLYVSPQAFETLRPTFIGWRGVSGHEVEQVQSVSDGSRYEVATSAYPLYVGLTAAIALHQSWGTATERYARICQLSAYCWQKLQEIPRIKLLKNTPPESGLISFTVNPIFLHQHIVNKLEERGYLLRTLALPNCIRVCVHYFTLETEIDQMIETLTEILSVKH